MEFALMLAAVVTLVFVVSAIAMWLSPDSEYAPLSRTSGDTVYVGTHTVSSDTSSVDTSSWSSSDSSSCDSSSSDCSSGGDCGGGGGCD